MVRLSMGNFRLMTHKITTNKNLIITARVQAERNIYGERSYRVATLHRSFSFAESVFNLVTPLVRFFVY